MKGLLIIITAVFSLGASAQHHIQDTCYAIVDQNGKSLKDSMTKEELITIESFQLQATSDECINADSLLSFTVIIAPINGEAKIFTQQQNFSASCLKEISQALSGSRILIERSKFTRDGNIYILSPTVIYLR